MVKANKAIPGPGPGHANQKGTRRGKGSRPGKERDTVEETQKFQRKNNRGTKPSRSSKHTRLETDLQKMATKTDLVAMRDEFKSGMKLAIVEAVDPLKEVVNNLEHRVNALEARPATQSEGVSSAASKEIVELQKVVQQKRPSATTNCIRGMARFYFGGRTIENDW